LEKTANYEFLKNEGGNLITRRTWREWWNWHSIRAIVLNRDNHTCQDCGNINELTVHHKIPWEQSGDDSLENLITICKECHRKIHHCEPRPKPLSPEQKPMPLPPEPEPESEPIRIRPIYRERVSRKKKKSKKEKKKIRSIKKRFPKKGRKIGMRRKSRKL